jgi:hypothetical protein
VRVESEVLAANAAGFELLSVFEAWGRVKKATGYERESDQPQSPVARSRDSGTIPAVEELRTRTLSTLTCYLKGAPISV